jgi:hypothetical protein
MPSSILEVEKIWAENGENGKLLKRKNTTDFIDCSKFVIL